ncbi:hypothetical protein GCM10009736_74870 [Actinomadura bangladeshensis]
MPLAGFTKGAVMGVHATLTGVRPQMARILRITRLDKRFVRPVAAAVG